ncbi:MAG TPA: resolvase [Armatimonadetes bacterium]|jgi:RNase H-fold protein (predicted Holliday junction resolvase)|nr:pre-16S rRNA-processing nuclease YqgF [Armatimonadota bacterium]HCD99428.1 resolvase [Armatimonadota bacterium]
MPEKVVLAVDPGTAKCGIALVRRGPDQRIELLWRKIARTEELAAAVAEAFSVRRPDLAIVGSGTHSKPVVHVLRELAPSLGILIVDEKNTTMQARERYWEHNPRRGWRRLLPSTMLVPPEPFDDFVALILAERVLLA